MRTLNPVDDKQILRQSAIDKKINEEIENLGEQIRELQTQQSTDEQALQDYKDQNTQQIDTNELVSEDIVASTLVADGINASGLVASDITASYGDITSLNTTNAVIENEIVTSSKITSAEIGSETVDNSIIGGLIATNATIENLNITGDYTFTDINATSVDSDQITTSQLISTDLVTQTADIGSADIDNVVVDTAVIDNMNSLAARIQDLENTQLYHKFNVQTLQDPAAGAKNVIEIPFFASGEYVVTLRDNDDKEIFSAYVTNSFSNLTFAYSRAPYTTGDPASLLEAKIKTYNTYPQLYLSTERGGKLYWHYSGRDLLLDSSPNTWATWPFPVQADTMNYICYHRAATVFSQHLDYGDNTSPAVGGATLYLTPTTDYAEHTNTGVEYNTQSDVPFNVYVPDQSVNTNDEVKFKKVAVDELAITSITENFMFLRSRSDGTFEVVLAVNNDTISGMENIDNPVTAKAIYNWNGIALGGSVEITDVATVDNSNYICSNNGNFYRRTQYVNKTPEAVHLDTKAIKKKVGADYLPFRIVSTGEYASREYVHYEVLSGEYAGLYFDFFTDDTGELYQSNYRSFAGFDDDWCIPTTLYDAYLLSCKYYATTERFPVEDSEGTNEYHIVHLGDGTVVHGDAIVNSTLTVNDKATVKELEVSTLVKSPFINTTASTVSITPVASTIISSPFIGLTGETSITGDTTVTGDTDIAGNTTITGSTLTINADTSITGATEINGNTEITGSTLTVNADTEINGNTSINGSTLTISAPDIQITGSSLNAPDVNSVFASIDVALARAQQLRTSSNKVYIDNTDDNENVCAVEAAFDTSTLVDLNITKPTVSTPAELLLGSTYIAKRDNDLATNLPVTFDGDVLTTVSVPFDITDTTNLKKALVAERTSTSTLVYDLKWSEDVGGSGSGTTLVLTQAEYATRAAITDMNDPDYIPNGALVVITDADTEYLHGEEQI